MFIKVMEYVMCYSTAFAIGFLVGCALTFVVQKEIKQDSVR